MWWQHSIMLNLASEGKCSCSASPTLLVLNDNLCVGWIFSNLSKKKINFLVKTGSVTGHKVSIYRRSKQVNNCKHLNTVQFQPSLWLYFVCIWFSPSFGGMNHWLIQRKYLINGLVEQTMVHQLQTKQLSQTPSEDKELCYNVQGFLSC